MKRLLFGRISERFLPSAPTAQLDLLQVMAEAAVPAAVTREVKVVTTKLESKPTGRQALPANLPKADIVLEPAEDITGLDRIGEEITEQLDYTPGKLQIRRYIRPKYAQVKRDGTGYTEVVIAPLPDFPIEKEIPGPGLLAQILVEKHADHLPVYRQIKRYQRDGVKLSASTISGWLDAIAGLLAPLVKEVIRVVLECDYVDNDQELAEYFLKEVQLLYAIERRTKEENLPTTRIEHLRQQEAVPILQSLKTWLVEN